MTCKRFWSTFCGCRRLWVFECVYLLLSVLVTCVHAQPDHDYYRSDYGWLIGETSGTASVWWCDATHKVPPKRELPTATSSPAT